MNTKEQRIEDARLGAFVREFLTVNLHHSVDQIQSTFPTPTIENMHATEQRKIRLSRDKDNGSIALEYIVAWN